MVKLILTIITVGLLVVALAGCSHSESVSTPAIGAPTYAGPIAETMLQALNSGDYASYSLAFSDEMKTRNSEDVFDQYKQFIQQKIGQYKSKKLSGVKVDGNNTTVSYIAKFTDEPGDVQVGIIFTANGDNVTVSDFWLNSPALFAH